MIEVEMTSLEIAELTGKKHKHVNKTIKKLIENSESYSKDVIKSKYIDSSNRTQPLYTISGELLKVLRLKYLHGIRMKNDTIQEQTALTTIEQIKGVKLERQYSVKKPCGNYYRIDGYDPVNNIAYEIDEEHHSYQQEKDYEREQYICEYLGCEFVRINVCL